MKYFVSLNSDVVEPKGTMFLFPYAGGGASVFKSWGDAFPDLEVYAVRYPGRETRFSENCISDIEILVNEIFLEMQENFSFGLPYYLFGHSMGTKIVYELALKLKERSSVAPAAVIISAGRAPCYKEPQPIYDLQDDEFIEGLKRYGGTPETLINNKALIDIFLPMLRSDFCIDEKYQDRKFRKLDSDILGLMGNVDSEMSLEELLKWKEYTSQSFEYEYINGDHMFINSAPEEVIKTIRGYICSRK